MAAGENSGKAGNSFIQGRRIPPGKVAVLAPPKALGLRRASPLWLGAAIHRHPSTRSPTTPAAKRGGGNSRVSGLSPRPSGRVMRHKVRHPTHKVSHPIQNVDHPTRSVSCPMHNNRHPMHSVRLPIHFIAIRWGFCAFAGRMCPIIGKSVEKRDTPSGSRTWKFLLPTDNPKLLSGIFIPIHRSPVGFEEESHPFAGHRINN